MGHAAPPSGLRQASPFSRPALRFATTRITDYSMRAPGGSPPKRDYRRFLARLAALEGGALEAPVARALGPH